MFEYNHECVGNKENCAKQRGDRIGKSYYFIATGLRILKAGMPFNLWKILTK